MAELSVVQGASIFAACMPIAFVGLISGISQGKAAAAAPYTSIFRRFSALTRTARYIRSEYHSASGRKQAGQERHMG